MVAQLCGPSELHRSIHSEEGGHIICVIPECSFQKGKMVKASMYNVYRMGLLCFSLNLNCEHFPKGTSSMAIGRAVQNL